MYLEKLETTEKKAGHVVMKEDTIEGETQEVPEEDMTLEKEKIVVTPENAGIVEILEKDAPGETEDKTQEIEEAEAHLSQGTILIEMTKEGTIKDHKGEEMKIPIFTLTFKRKT
jgi:hypothetical protein